MLTLKKFYLTYLFFVILCFINCKSISQQGFDESIISHFINDLFDLTIPPEKVVKTYLVFSTKKNEGGIIGYEVAKKHIEQIRAEIDKDNGWLMPNYKVAKLNVKYIAPYKKHQYLDKDSLFYNVDNNLKNKIYVLLNEDKNEILEYFQLKNKKIKSFSLFMKSGQAYFLYYE